MVNESKKGKGALGIFAIEPIEAYEPIFTFPLKKTINSEKINKKLFFPSKLNNLRNLPKIMAVSEEMIIPSVQIHFIQNLLFYIYHIDDYFFKYDLYSLPRDLYVPLFNISEYEMRFLQGNEAFGIITATRQKLPNSYYFMMDELRRELKGRFEMAFGRSQIPIDDFMYCYYIFQSQAFSEKNKAFLFPYLHLANDKSFVARTGTFSNFISGLASPFSRTKTFFLQEKVSLMNEILYHFGNVWNVEYLLVYGWIPLENYNECFEITFADDEILKEHSLPSKLLRKILILTCS